MGTQADNRRDGFGWNEKVRRRSVDPQSTVGATCDEKGWLATQRQVAIARAEARCGGQVPRRGLFHDMRVQDIGRLLDEG